MQTDLTGTPISFNQTDIIAAATRKRFKTGNYRLRVTNKPTGKINDNGNRVLTFTFAAVDENGQTRGPGKVKHWLTLPIRTEPEALEEAGLGADFKQKVPDTVGQAQSFLQGIYGEDEFPRFPKYAQTVNGEEMFSWNGGLISRDEKTKVVEEELIPNILQKLTEIWSGPETVIGAETYGRLYYRGNFLNIGRFFGVEPDELVDLTDPYEDPEAAAANGAAL